MYNTIFTNPTIDQYNLADTSHWNLAYDQLLAIVRPPAKKDDASTSLALIREILLPDSEHVYLAWLLCAFVPWARAIPEAPNAKAPRTVAAIIAREGMKADNTQTKIIENAVLSLPEILSSTKAIDNREYATTSPLKRKQDSILRGAQGMAIRRWGVYWPSSVIYALLVETMEIKDARGML